MGPVIDLPVSPLRSTLAEGSLRDAPVIASLMDGKTIAGRLVSLDGPQHLVIINRKGAGRTHQIRFSQLRTLNFITRHPINRDRHPLQEQAAKALMPRASQEFRILFSDRKLLTGRTRGSFVDEVGIHLFQLVDESHVSRLFIPAPVVSKYYIGQRKPNLDKLSGTDPAANEPSIEQSGPAPKRRKSDKRGGRASRAVSAAQLERALNYPTESGSLTAPRRIGEMLVAERVISREQLDRALQIQAGEPTTKLGEILVRMTAAGAEEIYAALAHKFGMPFVLLRDFFIDIECLRLVPADIARKYMLVPLLLHKECLVVAMDDPANSEALTILRFMTRYRIDPTIATRDDLQWAIAKYYGGESESAVKTAEPVSHAVVAPDSQHLIMDQAVASFVHNTILDAIRRSASDIHIMTERSYAEMLFRINGALVPIRRFNRVLIPAVMRRLRTMARLAGMPDNGPQQGQAAVLRGDEVIGLRTVIARDNRGEQAVIRILDSMLQLKRVSDIGLSSGDFQGFTEMLHKTCSMVIVSGPKGSGKTRTLYSALRTLKDNRVEIATIEAPVKVHVEGFEQWQAGEGQEGFAKALTEARASGPDVLMVDIVDDTYRLRRAMDTALGGCLVLSKLHANSAAAAVAAMIAMDRDHRLLNTTLAGVLAQQLVHFNCKFCMREEFADPSLRTDMGVKDDEVFYRGQGCAQCNGSGYGEEHLVFELLSVTPEMHALIGLGASAHAIHQQAICDGMVPVAETGLMLARTRKISLAEAHRLREKTRIS